MNPGSHDADLVGFAEHYKFRGKGPLCVALVVTQQAKDRGLPLNSDALLTEGDGQVLGLGKFGEEGRRTAVTELVERYNIG